LKTATSARSFGNAMAHTSDLERVLMAVITR
jgi:hypothetical protein